MSCLSSCSLSQRWRFQTMRSSVLQRIESDESDFAYIKVLGVVFQYNLWSGSLLYPLCWSMLKNQPIFSLVISKLMSALFL